MQDRALQDRQRDTARNLQDYDSVAANPAAFYDSPTAVVSDENLSRDQKLRFLRGWDRDLAGAATGSSDAILGRLVKSAIADIERGSGVGGWNPRSAWPNR